MDRNKEQSAKGAMNWLQNAFLKPIHAHFCRLDPAYLALDFVAFKKKDLEAYFARLIKIARRHKKRMLADFIVETKIKNVQHFPVMVQIFKDAQAESMHD